MSKLRILIVEDESIVAMDLKNRLVNLGYAVPLIVSSGEDAVEKAKETMPDIILMDIMLKGGMDGIEAAEKIRASHDIPILYLTAYSDDNTLHRAKITEPYGYLLKPFSERELLVSIETALYKHKMEMKLKQSEEWLATTLKSIGDAVITTDRNGCITFINPVAERLTGWKRDEAFGKESKDVFRLIDKETLETIESPIMQAIQGDVVVSLPDNTAILSKTGRETLIEIPIDDCVAPIRSSKNEIIGAVLVFRDATERRKAEEELRLSGKVFENSMDSIMITGANGAIIKVNDAFTKITGYTAKEVIGKNPSILKSGRHDAEFYKNMWKSLTAAGKWQGEIWNKRKNGDVYPESIIIVAIKDKHGYTTHYVSVARDITNRYRYEEKLKYQAYHDALTGLPNRLLFYDRLSISLSNARRTKLKLAVIFFDIDNLKLINDSLGHDVGDILLKSVAERLVKCSRSSDTVARIGGDEFTFVIQNVNQKKELGVIAVKMLDALQEPFAINRNKIQVTASIGISIYPDDGDNIQELMKKADVAMYNAKTAGRNQYQFYNEKQL